jgi:two-component system, OmpR family, sensor histidine kinase QseC
VRFSSLRERLRWLIVVALAAVLLPLGLLSFQRTVEEMDELSDGRLVQAARTISALVGRDEAQAMLNEGSLTVPVQKKAMRRLNGQVATHETEVGFQVFDAQGRLVLTSANLTRLPAPTSGTSHFEDLQIGHHPWRVFTLIEQPGGLIVRSAERYDSRHEIADALWLDHGLPLLLGLPLLAVVVGWAVRRGLRPLVGLARALSMREPGSREPVSLDHAPLELQPVLSALNGQLERQEDALERERRFSADVAHELRTPLASIMINLESAMATADPTEARDSLAGAHLSASALARRVEQLLALARLEAGGASSQRIAVDLVEVASGVLEELATVIADSGVELDFVRLSPRVIVQGYEAALSALLRNLVENALRHVPAGGQVQLVLKQDAHEATVEVIDDGPGIPMEHRAAVFARFHRETSGQGDGHGLGLSIVQRAVKLHDATVELLDSTFATGLRVRVAVPTAA